MERSCVRRARTAAENDNNKNERERESATHPSAVFFFRFFFFSPSFTSPGSDPCPARESLRLRRLEPGSSGGVIESLEPLRERLWRAAAPRSVLLSAGTPGAPETPGIFSLYRAAILFTSIAAAIAAPAPRNCRRLGQATGEHVTNNSRTAARTPGASWSVSGRPEGLSPLGEASVGHTQTFQSACRVAARAAHLSCRLAAVSPFRQRKPQGAVVVGSARQGPFSLVCGCFWAWPKFRVLGEAR